MWARHRRELALYSTSAEEVIFSPMCVFIRMCVCLPACLSVNRITLKQLWTNFDEIFFGGVGCVISKS